MGSKSLKKSPPSTFQVFLWEVSPCITQVCKAKNRAISEVEIDLIVTRDVGEEFYKKACHVGKSGGLLRKYKSI